MTSHPDPDYTDTMAARSSIVVWFKRLAIALALLAAAAMALIAGVIHHYEQDLPSTADLKKYDPPQVTRVLARDGTLLGELFVERRTVVGIDKIPPAMKLAAIAAEDAKFYEHDGLNYLGMLRAIAVNLRNHGARQGGSTITQQVIKNVLLTPERTMSRKIREAILARRIEQEMSKDEILDLYLNHIYFGHGRYGIEEASRYYFGKPVSEVTLAEAAMLAGIPKGPSIYSPRVDLEKAKRRRGYVLDQMAEKGFAPASLVEAAKKEQVVLAPRAEVLAELAPEVVDEVRRTLRDRVGDAAARGGYTITTTIDPALQSAARSAVRHNLDDYAKRHGALAPLKKSKREPAADKESPKDGSYKVFTGVVTGADDARGTLTVRVGEREGTVDLRESSRYNPKNVTATEFAPVGKAVRVSLIGSDPSDKAGEDEPPPRARYRLELGPESALVAIDVRSREVLAMIGSYEAVRGSLDRAKRAHRQPGSTFKPFVYSYAIHARQVTAASLLPTDPSILKNYKVGNHEPDAGRTKSLRDALARSVNVSAVWTMQQVGAANVAAWAQAAGIESKLGTDLSLALGSYEVTPYEMAAAYATFASGGVYEAPILIKSIVGPNGAEVPLPPRPPARRAMEETEAYLTTSLLKSVVEAGTGKRALALGRPIAGKTGTSNKSKDAWFVGYSPEVVCAVWTGFDDAASLGSREEGATAALPAFVSFMRDAHKKHAITDFAVPSGITRATIDPATGLLAPPELEGAVSEVFLAGTEPTEVSRADAIYDPEPAVGAAVAPGPDLVPDAPDSAQLPPESAPADPPPF